MILTINFTKGRIMGNKSESKYVIGLDIGGTKTECCLFELSNSAAPNTFFVPHQKFSSIGILSRERIPTDDSMGYETFVESVSCLIKNITSKLSIQVNDLIGIGIGMPGTISPKTGIMLNGNTKMFINRHFGDDLNKFLKTHLPIRVYNDANCFAVAEAFSGAGHALAKELGVSELALSGVGVILGTGVGGGIVINGSCITGSRGAAGEIGHTMLIDGGINCYCGRQGCAESYLSGGAIERMYFEISGQKVKSVDIFKQEAEGHVIAKQVIEKYQHNLAQFFANLTNLLDLDYIVCGGGVSNQDRIYLGLEDRVNEYRFINIDRIRILKHQISDSAGVMGAAMIVLNEIC